MSTICNQLIAIANIFAFAAHFEPYLNSSTSMVPSTLSTLQLYLLLRLAVCCLLHSSVLVLVLFYILITMSC